MYICSTHIITLETLLNNIYLKISTTKFSAPSYKQPLNLNYFSDNFQHSTFISLVANSNNINCY